MRLTVPGTYRARVTAVEDVQFGMSHGGNEQIAVPFVVTQGDAQGETITWFGSFTDKAVEITLKALRACGWQGDDLNDLTGVVDNEVELVCAVETYNEKTSLKVKWVNKPGEGKVKLERPLDGGQRAAFAARMKGTVIALRQGEGRPGAPSAATARKAEAKAHGAIDEVPF